jgi:hypothetical protein
VAAAVVDANDGAVEVRPPMHGALKRRKELATTMRMTDDTNNANNITTNNNENEVEADVAADAWWNEQ